MYDPFAVPPPPGTVTTTNVPPPVVPTGVPGVPGAVPPNTSGNMSALAPWHSQMTAWRGLMPQRPDVSGMDLTARKDAIQGFHGDVQDWRQTRPSRFGDMIQQPFPQGVPPPPWMSNPAYQAIFNRIHGMGASTGMMLPGGGNLFSGPNGWTGNWQGAGG